VEIDLKEFDDECHGASPLPKYCSCSNVSTWLKIPRIAKQGINLKIILIGLSKE